MAVPSERLQQIAGLVDALTFGEMMQFSAGVLRAKSSRQLDEPTLATMLHAWSARVVAGEESEPVSTIETIESSPGAVSAPSPKPVAKSPLPAVSLAKLRAITGLSTTDELAEFFALPTPEIEAARQVGPADYLRVRAEERPSKDEPAATPSAHAPEPSTIGGARFARTMAEFSELQAAE